MINNLKKEKQEKEKRASNKKRENNKNKSCLAKKQHACEKR